MNTLVRELQITQHVTNPVVRQASLYVAQPGDPKKIAQNTKPSIHNLQPSPISRRELQILSLISYGEPYKSVAATCGITMDTVARHLKNIYRKMGVPNNAAAVAYALRNGLIA